MSAANKFTPMRASGSWVFLDYCGGFDVRNCPEPEALAAFIVASCNAAIIAPPVDAGSVDKGNLTMWLKALYHAADGHQFNERLETALYHINLYAEQANEAGKQEGALSSLKNYDAACDEYRKQIAALTGRAEKAEADLNAMKEESIEFEAAYERESKKVRAWVSPLRYGSQVSFVKPPKPKDWDDDEEEWYCYPLFEGPTVNISAAKKAEKK